MLGWSIFFVILALIAKVLFVVFLVLLVASFVVRAFRGRSVV